MRCWTPSTVAEGCGCHDELMRLRSTNSAPKRSSRTPCFARRPTNMVNNVSALDKKRFLVMTKERCS